MIAKSTPVRAGAVLIFAMTIGLVSAVLLCYRSPSTPFQKNVSPTDTGDARIPGENVFVTDARDAGVPSEAPSAAITPILDNLAHAASLAPLAVDYPFDGSVFPPDMVAPTFLWHDPGEESDRWLIDIRFGESPHHIYALTSGTLPERVIDPEAISPSNAHYKRSDFEITARAWTPDVRTWRMIKAASASVPAVVTVYGVRRRDNRVLSSAHLTLTTSRDPVGAPIFYRDVPLMPAETKGGQIAPISKSALPFIAWRLRDISKPSAAVVLKSMPTCANCHSFSSEGSVLGMDLDGPDGDKGAYALAPVRKDMVIRKNDIITWNSYPDTPEGKMNFGLFSRVSPDGRHVISTLNESVFVQNYKDFRFLQSFYPTRGILVVYDRKTGLMQPLPGADNTAFVQTNGNWSPDGQHIVFSRARARNSHDGGELPEYAGDERETFIQYDLYRIPFRNGKGGVATPLPGASNNGMSNSFPKYSPDGKWIVFVKAAKGQLMRPDSRLHIVPAEGGKARELSCNLNTMNSWHSWSPNSRWLVFSSKGFRPFTQMFLTHIDERGNDTPAILIPDSTADNRAVNIPEFLNAAGDAIASISAPTQESYRYFNRGNELAKQKRWSEALTDLDKAIALNPYHAASFNDKGMIMLALGRHEEAITCLNKALELAPSEEKHYINLGIILNAAGRTDEAVEHYLRTLENHPTMAGIHLALGDTYWRQGRIQEAAACYRSAIQGDPNLHAAHYNLGVVCQSQGIHDEAAACFRRALKIDPADMNASLGLARSLGQGGHLEDARRQYLALLETDPGHIEGRSRLVALLLQQKDYPSAAEHCTTILASQPQNVLALNCLAWVFSVCPDEAIRDPQRAVELARKAGEITRYELPLVLDTLAASLAATGEFEQAVVQAEKAVGLADSAGNKGMATEIRKRLALYRMKRPYVAPAP